MSNHQVLRRVHKASDSLAMADTLYQVIMGATELGSGLWVVVSKWSPFYRTPGSQYEPFVLNSNLAAYLDVEEYHFQYLSLEFVAELPAEQPDDHEFDGDVAMFHTPPRFINNKSIFEIHVWELELVLLARSPQFEILTRLLEAHDDEQGKSAG